LAALHSGVLKGLYECEECRKNPKNMKTWGCDKESLIPDGMQGEDENGNDIIFRNCPRRFIPSSILKWYSIYNYHKIFTGAKAPEYNNVSIRFMMALWVYENKLNGFINKKYEMK
jgi:hypothetical protein